MIQKLVKPFAFLAFVFPFSDYFYFNPGDQAC